MSVCSVACVKKATCPTSFVTFSSMLPVAMARPSVGGAVVVLYYSHNSAFVNDVVCIPRSGKEAWTHRRFFISFFCFRFRAPDKDMRA